MTAGFAIGVMFDLDDIVSLQNWKVYTALTLQNPEVPGFNGVAFRVAYKLFTPDVVVHNS
jgi:hypothetical protein